MLRQLLAVTARAALQWALASLLLANGAAFCLIAAVSERFRLGPPCMLCARVHRLLCSSGGDGRDALRLILCDAHLAQAVGTEQRPGGAADPSPSDGGGKESRGLDVDDRDKVSALESHRVVSIGSEICEQDQQTNGGDAGRAGGGTDDSPLVSLFELAPIAAHPQDDGDGEQSSSSLHKDPPPPPMELLHNVEGGERLTVGQLLSLRAQRRELDALRAELDAERRARAEAEEYQRQLEEQGELDREAARLAMELVHETEREKRALQQQLDACRVRPQLGYGGGQQQRVGEEEEGRCHGDNNYHSLVDFLPGSVYSSSPDLANLLKLYNEPGNGDSRGREGFAPAVTVVAEEVEEEVEQVQVAVALAAGIEPGVNNVGASAAIASGSLHGDGNTSCHDETVTEAA